LIFSFWHTFTFGHLFSGVESASQADIEQHLTLGMQLLARGQYSDALSHFHAAIGKNVFTYILIF